VLDESVINQLPVSFVDVAELTVGDTPRLAGEDPDHVEALMAAPYLPPIVVHRPTMRVIDGRHRLRAAVRQGESTIAARLLDCDEDEAFVIAVGLNVAHGLPLALADRKRAAERIIGNYPQWSDRRVAAVTGVSPGTVAEIRRRAGHASTAIERRIGQDGRVRALDVSAGRRLAGQLMIEKPHLSLRQVARAAAISPETARDVRNRLRKGEDLVPDGHRSGLPAETTSGRPRDPGGLDLAGPHRRQPVIDRAALVNRLRSDPALRYTDTGRNLLRLLMLHTTWTDEWDAIVTHLPPHCSGPVAALAREFAELWSDFADRAGKDLKNAR
jgi:ParB-like chromosome segregation protein Spo0J